MKTIKEFVDAYKAKRFMNMKTATEERSEWLRKELEIKTYLPFKKKRELAEMVVERNIEMVDGIKKHDEINSYICFVVAVIGAYTNLRFNEDPVSDYDLLAENGLLPLIVAEFQNDYTECDIIRKMALDMELADNNVNVLIGRFLDNILKKLDGVGEVLNGKLDGFDIKDLLGDIKPEDLAKLNGLLDRLK